MRILVAVEAVDGRKGIDSLARLCQERLLSRPFLGLRCLFSAAGGERRFAYWSMTARDFGSRRSGYRRGVFAGGRKAGVRTRWRGALAAHQLQVLLAAGDPSATQAAPAWRPVSVVS